MKQSFFFILLLIGLASCHYPRPEIKEEAYTVVRQNANLELREDSVVLEILPVKDTYITLYKNAQVVVAEIAVHPEDSVDSVWVKVAHSQEAQGWLRESELISSFIPVDSISQFIYLFSGTHISYFIVIMAMFIGIYLFRLYRRKQIRMVYFNDIDSIYPFLLCLLMAISATLYESMQLFVPETWQQYFFNPTLSPFKVPFILSAFLISIWLIILVLLASLDDAFSLLPSPADAFFYVLGLLSVCIFCYFFFILTTRFYIGYICLTGMIFLFVRKVRGLSLYRYNCGNCGGKLQSKGACPHCGAMNR